MSLTETDRKILRHLQRNALASNQEVAEAAAMSPSACWRRIKQLEADGLIAGHVTILVPEAAGFHFSAIVHVTLARHERQHVDAFINAVVGRPEVLECFSTTGEADYHLRVVSRDKEAYNQFLDEFLFRLPGLAQVRTNVILKDVKFTTNLPV